MERKLIRGGQALQRGSAVGDLSRMDASAPAGAAGAAVGQAAPDKWIRVTLSDGRQIEVHPDDLEELQKRDPDLKIDDED